MGRGRAKAKQTKVARDLKYQTLATDFTALQRELGAPHEAANGDEVDDVDEEASSDDDAVQIDDRYAAYADLDDDSAGSANSGAQRR